MAFIYEKNKQYFTILLPIATLIIISTLFIRQHNIIDVIGGLTLAYIVFTNKHIFAEGI
jgi:membrane-associated phospholipid phosphatase